MQTADTGFGGYLDYVFALDYGRACLVTRSNERLTSHAGYIFVA